MGFWVNLEVAISYLLKIQFMTYSDKTHRRDFLKNSTKATIAIGISGSALGSFVQSCSSTKKMVISPFKTGFDQQPLPYAYTALEDIVDATTMEIHYTRHAATYSKNLKEAAAGK